MPRPWGAKPPTATRSKRKKRAGGRKCARCEGMGRVTVKARDHRGEHLSTKTCPSCKGKGRFY